MSSHLIVAYQTAGGQALRQEVQRLVTEDPAAQFVLLVPATRTQHLFTWTDGEARAVARERADEAAEGLRACGAKLIAVRIGHSDPFLAVSDELSDGTEYDTIIVSTFPAARSRWLRAGLPSRLEKQFGIPVTHVVME